MSQESWGLKILPPPCTSQGKQFEKAILEILDSLVLTSTVLRGDVHMWNYLSTSNNCETKLKNILVQVLIFKRGHVIATSTTSE